MSASPVGQFCADINSPELCRGVLGLMSFDPVPKEPLRRNKAERRMTTTTVVKHFDVFEQIDLRVLMRPVARGMNPFVLQAVKEAFRRGVDAPMSSSTGRIGQVGQNERVQLPDDIALQAAVNLLV